MNDTSAGSQMRAYAVLIPSMLKVYPGFARLAPILRFKLQDSGVASFPPIWSESVLTARANRENDRNRGFVLESGSGRSETLVFAAAFPALLFSKRRRCLLGLGRKDAACRRHGRSDAIRRLDSVDGSICAGAATNSPVSGTIRPIAKFYPQREVLPFSAYGHPL